MAYIIASDETGGAKNCLDTVCKILKDKGNTVNKMNVDSNSEGTIAQHCTKGDIPVFIVNGVCLGTFISFHERFIKKIGCQHVYFGFPKNLMQGSHYNKEELLSSKKLVITNDGTNWSQKAYEWSGKYTPVEVFEKLDGVDGIWADNCEQLAEKIMAGGGLSTGGSSSDLSSTGGGMQIKDATFEDCIRRICAATDSVFIVENNAAVMFPYNDWMAFTLQKDMETIDKDNMDPDVFEIQYNNNGTYNKVTATWGKTTDKSQTSSTTTKKKGKFTTKETNNTDGTGKLSKQYDSLVDQFGELEKKVEIKATDKNTVEYIVNALLIQYIREFNNSYHVRSLNKTKYVGGTFYAVKNLYNDKTDILYLNGYTILTQEKEPLFIDLDFKYGPERVENIEDYQKYSGTGSSGTGSSSGSDVKSSDLIGIGNELASKYTYCGKAHTYEQMKKTGCGDCHAMSDALYIELSEKGYTVKIVQYVSSGSDRHRSVMYNENGQWKDFPYRDTKLHQSFNNTKGSEKGKVIKTNENSGNSGNSGNNGGTNT